MNTVCFTSVVYGWYQDYIPLFVYSVLKSYPQHFVRIFLYENLSDGNKASLELIKAQGFTSFEIIESFTELDVFGIPHKAAYRFIMGREYFPEFNYIYFGDIDFIVLNEDKNNFYEPYLEHCQKTGLPFSNSWNYDWGRFRACGLHFVIKNDYFNAMDKWIAIMKGQNSFKSQCPYNDKAPTYDEEMLYYMLVHEFDLRCLLNYGRKFPGIHMADFRPANNHKMIFCKNNYAQNKDTMPVAIAERYLVRLRRADSIVKTDLFNQIHGNMSSTGKSCIDSYLHYIS